MGALMKDLKYSEQQTQSPETLTELNPQELLQRIHAAETAILSRLQGMRINSIDLVEGQAIQDALDCLVRLTKDTVEFADSLVEVNSRRRKSFGLGYTDNVRISSSTHGFFPQFLSILIFTKFLYIVFSDRHGFHPNPPF